MQPLYPRLSQRQSTAILKVIHDKSITISHSVSPPEAPNQIKGCDGSKQSCEFFQWSQDVLEEGKELEQKLEKETATQEFREALLAHVQNLQSMHEAAKSCHS